MTEDQILQISNDISEGMLSAKVTKGQLVEVVKYFRRAYDTEIQSRIRKRDIENWEAFCLKQHRL